MMKRWICPKCGEGKLAPSKPRRDDARRYCLACSEKTGRLVERTCPALDAGREARAVAKREKESKAAVRRKAARARSASAERERLTVGGAYLPERVGPYWHALCDEARKAAPAGTYIPAPDAPPTLEVERSSSPTNASGRGSRRRTYLRLGAKVDRAAALELLLHELCHGACSRVTDGAHGPTFRKTLRNAAALLWGVEVIVPDTHRYVIDDLIVVELRKKWGLPPGPTHWLDRERARKERRSAGKHAALPAAPAETPAESAGETSP